MKLGWSSGYSRYLRSVSLKRLVVWQGSRIRKTADYWLLERAVQGDSALKTVRRIFERGIGTVLVRTYEYARQSRLK